MTKVGGESQKNIEANATVVEKPGYWTKTVAKGRLWPLWRMSAICAANNDRYVEVSIALISCFVLYAAGEK